MAPERSKSGSPPRVFRDSAASATAADMEPEVSKVGSSGANQEAAALVKSNSSRFKPVAWMLVALRRWQNAMNPTITFGKPQSGDQSPMHAGGPNTASLAKLAAQRNAFVDNNRNSRRLSLQHPVSASQRLSGGALARSTSGRPSLVTGQHGHKGTLLLKPLPDPISST